MQAYIVMIIGQWTSPTPRNSKHMQEKSTFKKELVGPEVDGSNPVALQSPRIVEQPVQCKSDRPRLSQNQNEQQTMLKGIT